MYFPFQLELPAREGLCLGDSPAVGIMGARGNEPLAFSWGSVADGRKKVEAN